jgi:hypothetical protein
VKKRVLILLAVTVFVFIAVLPLFAGFTATKITLCVFDGEDKHLLDIGYELGFFEKIKVNMLHDGCGQKYINAEADKGGIDFMQAALSIIPTIYAPLAAVCGGEFVEVKNAVSTFNPNNEDKPFEYSKEVKGRIACFEKNLKNASLLLVNGGKLVLEYDEVLPEVTLAELTERTQKISGYRTGYSRSSFERKSNIALATDKFNGIEVKAGEKLSFNKTTGKRTEEAGYMSARVIEGGEYVQGIGGGVCQVSTTLYNAWVYAGLAVLESKSHSIPSSYVPICADAAVSEHTDLVLLNSSDFSIFISSKTENDRIIFTLYGKHGGYEIRLENSLTKTIPAEDEPKRKGEGEYLLSSTPAKAGLVYNSYQVFYKNDKRVKSVLIRKSYYAPRPPIHIYGEPPQTEPLPNELQNGLLQNRHFRHQIADMNFYGRKNTAA